MSSGNLLPICFQCARLRGVKPGIGWTCDAFERGIPTEILASRHDHRQPYEGDGGKTFEPKVRSGEDVATRIATDPPVSSAQRRAMFAAAAGHSNIGIPQSVGREFAEADPGGKLPEKKTARDMTRGAWRSIYEGLSNLARFFGEEEQEPEHHEAEGKDAEPAKGRAASVAFTTADGRVLLLRRGKDERNYPGYWALPGGQAEGDEDHAAAARRECHEEIGDCGFDGMAELRRVRTPGGFDHVTYTVPVTEAFEPKLNREHDAFAWTPVTELPEKTHPGVRAAIDEALEKAQARWIAREHGKIPARDNTSPESAWYAKIVATDRGRRVFDRLQKDMAPGDFDELKELLDEFFSEEAREPEHHRTAGLSRDVDEFSLDEWSEEARRAALEARRAHSQTAPISYQEKRPHPFVSEFAREHDSIGKQKAHLRTVPTEKLHTALKIIHSHQDKGAMTNTVKGLIEEELKNRGGSRDGIILDTVADPDRRMIGKTPVFGAQDHAIMAYDRASVRHTDDDGRLHIDEANICEARIDPYYGEEINAVMADYPDWVPLEPKRKYRVFRDPKELSKPETIKSANAIPILCDHVATSAKDHKFAETVGSTGTNARWDEPFIKNALVFWPQTAIDDIDDGRKAQLSPGYKYVADPTPGTWRGEPYDIRMKDIAFNHLAQVPQGRQGPRVVVPDADPDWQAWLEIADAIRGIAA